MEAKEQALSVYNKMITVAERQRCYTVQDVADMFETSTVHIYRLIQAGQIRAIDISTAGSLRKKVRILDTDLEAFFSQNQVTLVADGTN